MNLKISLLNGQGFPPSNIQSEWILIELKLYNCSSIVMHEPHHSSWIDRWCESTTRFVYGQPLVNPIQELSLQINVMMLHDTTYTSVAWLYRVLLLLRLCLESEGCNGIWICNQKCVRGDRRLERRNIIFSSLLTKTNAEKTKDHFNRFSAGSDIKWHWVLMNQPAFSFYIILIV